ncbi:MAG TPA: response regulator [Acidimicrobiales bacterium]|jgi:DNA-binding response OmpR family regulator|nr:response regulator [Acidimicrobiales bacterium]
MSVLVVDDDPLIAGMLRLVLEGEGYEVREAPDGRAALDSVRDDAPDVMVLDMMMPHVDGYGVLEALRDDSLGSSTRVVMLTCCSQEQDVARCLSMGADDYLTKPVDVDFLLRTVQDLLAIDMGEVQARRAEVADQSVLAERVSHVLNRHSRQFLAG